MPQRLDAQLGPRDTALRQHKMCVDALHRDLNVEPEQKTRRLYHDSLRVRPPTR